MSSGIKLRGVGGCIDGWLLDADVYPGRYHSFPNKEIINGVAQPEHTDHYERIGNELCFLGQDLD